MSAPIETNPAPRLALHVAEDFSRLRYLRPGELFEDMNGQQFVKLGAVKGARRMHQVALCTWSPKGRRTMGPIYSAFFTRVGDVHYLGGNQEVLRARPALALMAGGLIGSTSPLSRGVVAVWRANIDRYGRRQEVLIERRGGRMITISGSLSPREATKLREATAAKLSLP